MEGQVEERPVQASPPAKEVDEEPNLDSAQKPRKRLKKQAAAGEQGGASDKQRRKGADDKPKKKRKQRRESAAEWELPLAGRWERRPDPLEPYRQQLKDELMERFRDKMPKEFNGYFRREDPWELGPLIPQLQMVGALPTPWPAKEELAEEELA